MDAHLEPAVFLFSPVVRKLVEHVDGDLESHVAFDQARAIVAKALGCTRWDDLKRFTVRSTSAILETLDADIAWGRVVEELSRLGISADDDIETRLFDMRFGVVPVKPSSRMSALFDAQGNFRGIEMCGGGWAEHHDVPDFSSVDNRVLARRVAATSEGVFGLDRALFSVGGLQRCALDEAVDEQLDGFGCVPFLCSSAVGEFNVYTERCQFLHGGWDENYFFLAGNGEASALVSRLAEWYQRGELVATGHADMRLRVFIHHRDAQDVSGLVPRFESGWMAR